ncbi:hypothetical protein MJO28_009024 [Puccinia striiformis f. sp. tritici]|uniref:Uncharacterized protein n=2 Tax=Puccinia striiformis TaxID=27350 RepID=A0A2S4URY4_9BASI|nr:hypothetical protein MJO28_009024 [Puccinia striiformis f. sp. tritici]POW00084.1 hypothetical protein PSTT_13378 [Puccinia striiformis]
MFEYKKLPISSPGQTEDHHPPPQSKNIDSGFVQNNPIQPKINLSYPIYLKSALTAVLKNRYSLHRLCLTMNHFIPTLLTLSIFLLVENYGDCQTIANVVSYGAKAKCPVSGNKTKAVCRTASASQFTAPQKATDRSGTFQCPSIPFPFDPVCCDIDPFQGNGGSGGPGEGSPQSSAPSSPHSIGSNPPVPKCGKAQTA